MSHFGTDALPDQEYTVDHRLSDADENVHSVWDNDIEPALTVSPGDVVQFDCRDAVDGQIDHDTTAAEITDVSFDPVHPLTGPVAVEGADPGDVLEVQLLDLEHEGWGFTNYFPSEMGLGLLPEAFDEPGLHVWDLEGDVGHFVGGIEVPLDPFPGVIGVAPAADGTHDTLPPRSVGGNLDVKQATAGSTVYLPVEVEGASFSTGDCHAAQGDGEVCVTGIEAPMTVTARLDVRSDLSVEQPELATTGPFTATGRDEPAYATTGVADDLMEATRLAIRHAIDHLATHRGLSRGEAYVLCSAAVDLKISQVVDAPNWTVTAFLPESIFPDDGGDGGDDGATANGDAGGV